MQKSCLYSSTHLEWKGNFKNTLNDHIRNFKLLRNQSNKNSLCEEYNEKHKIGSK